MLNTDAAIEAAQREHFDPTIATFGDRALLLSWPERIDPQINRQVHALAAHIAAQGWTWVQDLVPAYASLAVVLDDADGAPSLAEAQQHVKSLLTSEAGLVSAPPAGSTISIPVCYDPRLAADLIDLSAQLGLSPAALIARHTAPEYRVAMIGFAPGFPYLLGLDPSLQAERLPTPRRRVAAGSVAIGGAQTGIYPAPGPGGWRIIGRTPLCLFDPQRRPPSLLQAGDRVRFRAIDPAQFDAMRVDPA